MPLPLVLIALCAHVAVLVRVLTLTGATARGTGIARPGFAWIVGVPAGGASIELLLHAGSVGFSKRLPPCCWRCPSAARAATSPACSGVNES